MSKAISNIIETIIRSSTKQTMNMLYHDGSPSTLPALLAHSKKLNFVRTSNITNDTLDIDYSGYFCHDYLSMESVYRQIINPMHMRSIVCFNDTPYRLLKKEDLLILKTNLTKARKLSFCPYIHNIWKQYLEDTVLINPGIPDFELTDIQDRKSIVVVSCSNKKQARSLHSQLMEVLNDVGLLVDFNYDVMSLIGVFNEYKTALVLDNAMSCLLASAANCAVISPIPFYEDIITYHDSNSLNEAIGKSLGMADNKETVELGAKIREDHPYDKFDNNLYEFILSTTKEPFLL